VGLDGDLTSTTAKEFHAVDSGAAARDVTTASVVVLLTVPPSARVRRGQRFGQRSEHERSYGSGDGQPGAAGLRTHACPTVVEIPPESLAEGGVGAR
jgi:hypothetical protein